MTVPTPGQGQEPTVPPPAGTTPPSDSQTTPPPTGEAGQEPAAFSREYVESLRRENASYRTRAATAETEVQRFKTAQMTEQERAQEAAKQEKARADRLQSDLQLARLESHVAVNATKYGIADPRAVVRLLPATEIEFGDDGAPKNLDKVITAMKTEFPILFGQARGSSDGGAGRGAGAQPTEDMNSMIRRASGRG